MCAMFVEGNGVYKKTLKYDQSAQQTVLEPYGFVKSKPCV